jgi:hypothetical protein
MLWNGDGSPSWGWGIRCGQKHGLSLEWDDRGNVEFAERYVDGLAHGVARQWNSDGLLLLEYEIAHGTGTELFCDRQDGTLAEEIHLKDGVPHGARRWWSYRRRPAVFGEEYNRDGIPHGISRWWTSSGDLARGYPKYFVQGDRLDKRTYVRRASRDASLVPYRERDDQPQRSLPAEFTRWLERRRDGRKRGATS